MTVPLDHDVFLKPVRALAENHFANPVITVAAESIGQYYYGAYHPMKPFRITMAHHLVLAYDMHKHLDVYQPPLADEGAILFYFHFT